MALGAKRVLLRAWDSPDIIDKRQGWRDFFPINSGKRKPAKANQQTSCYGDLF